MEHNIIEIQNDDADGTVKTSDKTHRHKERKKEELDNERSRRKKQAWELKPNASKLWSDPEIQQVVSDRSHPCPTRSTHAHTHTRTHTHMHTHTYTHTEYMNTHTRTHLMQIHLSKEPTLIGLMVELKLFTFRLRILVKRRLKVSFSLISTISSI